MELYRLILAAVAVLLPIWIARRVIGRRFGWSGRVAGGLLLAFGVCLASVTLRIPVSLYVFAGVGFATGFWVTYPANDKRELATDLVATLAIVGLLGSLLTSNLPGAGLFLLSAAVATAAGRYFGQGASSTAR